MESIRYLAYALAAVSVLLVVPLMYVVLLGQSDEPVQRLSLLVKAWRWR